MRSTLFTIAKAVLTCAALGYVVYVVDPQAIGSALMSADPWWIAAAVLLLPVNLALDAWVWRILVSPVAPRLPWSTVAGAVMSGFALGFFTPARTGEFAGRAFYLEDADRWTVSVSVLAQRAVDMAATLNMGFAAFVYAFATGLLPMTWPWLAVASVGGGIAGLLTAFTLQPAWGVYIVRRVLRRYPSVEQRFAFLSRLSGRDILLVAGLSTTRYVVFASQFVCLICAFLPAAPILQAGIGVALMYFVKFLLPPITFVDLGIREGAAVFFFGLLGFSEAAALNAALLIFIINLVLPAIAGLPFISKLRWHPKSSSKATAP